MIGSAAIPQRNRPHADLLIEHAAQVLTCAASSGNPVGRIVEQLTDSAAERLRRMLRCATTRLESKSGYGLNLAGDLKLLEENHRLQVIQPVDVEMVIVRGEVVLTSE